MGVAAAAIGLALWGSGALERAELVTLDARYQARGERAAPAGVVVVGVDEATVRELGRWPYPRRTQARALRRLAALEPAAIAYDVQLSELTDPDQDEAIAAALGSVGPLVLATTRYDAVNGPDVIFRDDDLRAVGVRVGHAGFPETPDNVFRRVPLAVDGLPAFAVAAAETAQGGTVRGDGFGDGGALIDYAGPPGTIPQIAYADVLAGRADAAAIRGRVVVVGTTEPTLGDTHPTPFGGRPMSGPEINANAIATILDGVPLRDAPGWLDAVLIVALAGVGAATALLRRAWMGLAAAVVAGGAYLVAAQVAFGAGTVLDVTHPVLTLLLAAVGGVAVTAALIERERARLRTEFARFVPADVVGQVIDQAGDDQRLGGRRVYCSVMFADLRGFTGAAERMPPEAVIEVLNRYLTQMSDAILDHGGTLVSYMGDGIMALFGAPLEQPDHADRAVAAAREMRDLRLPAFNAWCADHLGGEPFRMGIGVASGFVMSGNVGSARRLEYAAVGDTTNVASRLQSLTKETPHTVLLADSTRAALTASVADLVAVGALDVRGRQVPAAVWTLAGPPAPEGG